MRNKKIIIILLLTFLVCSCNETDTLNEIQIKEYILTKSFLDNCKYNSRDEIYNFRGDGTFIHVSQHRRSGEKIFYNGSYEIKKSKYKDTNLPFVYCKLVYSDTRWSLYPQYLVYYQKKLVKAEYIGETARLNNIKPTEDSYGLNIPSWLIEPAMGCQIVYTTDLMNFTDTDYKATSTESQAFMIIDSASKVSTAALDICKCLTEPGNSAWFIENEAKCNQAISIAIGVADWRKVNLNSDLQANSKFDSLKSLCIKVGLNEQFDNNLKINHDVNIDSKESAKIDNKEEDTNNENIYEEGYYITNGSTNKYVYFHNAPNKSTKRSAHFDGQETFYVQKIDNGFGFLEFTNDKGQKSVGWVLMSDLILKP